MFKRHQNLKCPRCGKTRRFRKPPINHGSHFGFTLLSCGLWGIGWLCVISHWLFVLPWRCSVCGGLAENSVEKPITGRSTYKQLSRNAAAW